MMWNTGVANAEGLHSFVGHLEGDGYTATDYLAASSCAGILFETTIVIFSRGFVQVLSVLCSQAYGSGNHLLMGRWLQTVLFVCAILSLPMVVMWWYAGTSWRFMHFRPTHSCLLS